MNIPHKDRNYGMLPLHGKMAYPINVNVSVFLSLQDRCCQLGTELQNTLQMPVSQSSVIKYQSFKRR
eukprot:scaffold5975_cov99-Cylindrotheca_fusiformis.AAC.2